MRAATNRVWGMVGGAWGEGRSGCCCGGEAKDIGEREDVVDVREGEGAGGSELGGGGGGTMTVAVAAGSGDVRRSSNPACGAVTLPASPWSGDMAPSLLDSSSYCT